MLEVVVYLWLYEVISFDYANFYLKNKYRVIGKLFKWWGY